MIGGGRKPDFEWCTVLPLGREIQIDEEGLVRLPIAHLAFLDATIIYIDDLLGDAVIAHELHPFAFLHVLVVEVAN